MQVSLTLLHFEAVLWKAGWERSGHSHLQPSQASNVRCPHSVAPNLSFQMAGRLGGQQTKMASCFSLVSHDQIPGNIILGIWLFFQNSTFPMHVVYLPCCLARPAENLSTLADNLSQPGTLYPVLGVWHLSHLWFRMYGY